MTADVEASVAAESQAMSDISPSIAPEIDTAATGPDTLLDLVGHLGAALIRSDKITDPVLLDHLQSAHRIALYLYSSSSGTRRYRANSHA